MSVWPLSAPVLRWLVVQPPKTSEWQDLKRQSAIAKLGMSEAGWKQIEIEFCATITRWRQPLKVLQTPTYSLRKPHFALFSWTRWIVG